MNQPAPSGRHIRSRDEFPDRLLGRHGRRTAGLEPLCPEQRRPGPPPCRPGGRYRPPGPGNRPGAPATGTDARWGQGAASP
ncbi:hypothetical protein CBW56_06420 [Denitratisoma oestradiolicum]|nr:hypothetical protein CBW56_06420 [Denitratisoma oestradiolicum]